MSERKQPKKSNSHRCRDEIKSDKALEAKRHKIINNVDNLTKAMLEEPSLWGRPEFNNLRKFVELVSNDPSKFPKDSNMSSIVFKDNDETLLSIDFGKEIESGNTFNSNDVDFNPILQIINLSTKFRKFTLNSTEHAQKQVTLEVSDKSGHCLTVKMASQLNDVSGNLKSGCVIEIPMFQILKHSCEIMTFNIQLFHAPNSKLLVLMQN